VNEPIIVIKDGQKVYQKRGQEPLIILKDINLVIEKGEFVSLMGPSGSGKTTLLNAIGGLDTLSSGELWVCDSNVQTLKGKALSQWRAEKVSYIFQFYNLIPVMTAFQNVELPLSLTPLNRSERRHHVEAALSLVGLQDRMHHKPDELSGGQQQRVAIARALVTDPAILLGDEPTGDLDAKSAEEVMLLLETLNKDNRKTILIVTHDPKVAARTQRRLHLDKGLLQDSHHEEKTLAL
jgi:putative ABC transport system ATP-binding protein